MRKRQRKVETGKTYGYLKVIGIFRDKPREYTVQCLRCGKTYTTTGQGILNYSAGCHACRIFDKLKDRYSDYTGQYFGDLEILGFAGQGKRGIALARCLCHRCGRETVIPYKKIIRDGVKICADCSLKKFSSWKGQVHKYDAEGTNLKHINSDRKLNSNTSTGYKGVSRMKSGKYRAYINFCHHQYHLGSYDKIEDAVDARKAAEKEIYGSFLDWYKEHHPKT